MILLTENCSKENLSSRLKSVSLIIFNYDRCVEHFLYNALQNYYGIKPEEAANLISEMGIYHPYGVVGKLPWQDGEIAFGAEIQPQKLLQVAQQIKTFAEGTDPESSEIISIRDSFVRANCIVFLGFAYHKLNMQLLMSNNPTLDPMNTKLCFGTAKGISTHDCAIIAKELETFFQSTIKMLQIRNELDCSQIFNEYWRSLSLP
jgi:hypothetical protein